MDKKKTGNIIREARNKKKYTQSELGDLLGVSNKAVSRWENGESFPDIGVLENLAQALDLQIKDIVTGDIDSKEEAAVTEVLSVAKLQTKEKQRKLISGAFLVMILILATIIGYSSLCNKSVYMIAYIILMVVSYALAIIVSYKQKNIIVEANTGDKYEKWIAVISLVWCVVATGTIMISVSNGYIPFGVELSLVGPLVNWQLIIITSINIALMSIRLIKFIKDDEMIHWGFYVSIAAVYISVFYADLIHRLDTVEIAINIYSIRTLMGLAALTIVLMSTKVYKKI